MTDTPASNDLPIALIAAVAENGVIGSEGNMPWRLSEDLKWFKKNTIGKPVVMGRKTFQSIGMVLPERANIVITRDKSFKPEGVLVVGSVADALMLAQSEGQKTGASEICIIGGGEIYAQTIALASRLYLTRVMTRPEGDTYFPEIDSENWDMTRKGLVPLDAKNSHTCEFFVFDRTLTSTASQTIEAR